MSITQLSQDKEEHFYIYIDKSIKYKLRNDKNVFKGRSTFIKVFNKKQKNLVIGCVYKHLARSQRLNK